MPSTYTSSLKLTLPATGENVDSWGTVVNSGITSLVDDAVAGTAAITLTGSDYTLTSTDGATNEARKMFIVATGTPGAARNVICPAVSKLYFVRNNTTGGFALTLKTSAGTGISVPNGKFMLLMCDGTNVIEALTNVGALTGTSFSGAVAATTLSASSTVSGTGFSTYLASPPAIGGTAAAAVTGTTITASTQFSGPGTGLTGTAASLSIGGNAATATTATTATNLSGGAVAATTLSASSTVSGTGFSTYLASPPAIGGTAAAAGAFTTLSASSTVSGAGFTARFASPGPIGSTTASTGAFTTVTATGNITAYFSDDRLKTRFNNIDGALAKVKSLSGFYYEANETAQALGYEAKREVGVSAQAVQAVMPEVVAPAPIDEQYLTVRYERLVPLLIEAIKELEAQVAELRSQK